MILTPLHHKPCPLRLCVAGHRDAHSTRALYGTNPVFTDESTWLLACTPELEASLRTREVSGGPH